MGMRITVVTPLYPPDLGRLATHTKELSKRLAKEHRVTLVAYGELPEQVSGVIVRVVSKQLPIILRLFHFTVRLWQESRNSDCLYVGDGASVGLPALLVGRLRRIPVIRFMLDDEARERAERSLYTGIPEETFAQIRKLSFKLRVIRALQNWILRRATRVIVPSTFFKDVLVQVYHLPGKKLTVVPFPTEAPQLLPFPIPQNPLQLFTHSPLNFFSGVEPLLHALAALKKQFPNIKLVIADTGAEIERLKQQAEKLGLGANVDFLGSISRAEYWYLLQSSSLFLVNQTSVNNADPIYQAYRAHIPVIASDIACHREAVRDKTSGLLVESTDVSALTTAITQLLQDAELRAKLISGGMQVLTARGDWDEHTHRIISLV
jgi:glycosyltransferase involved in cell wall biosynthesis